MKLGGLVAALVRVPPLWWARFVFLALVVSVCCTGWAIWTTLHVTAEAERQLVHAYALRTRAIAVLDSLARRQCVPYRPSMDQIRIFRGPFQ